MKMRERTEGQRERETWEVDDRVNQTEREREWERDAAVDRKGERGREREEGRG